MSKKPTLEVYALPTLIDRRKLPQSVAVVVDVLRASTTITYALEAGARAIYPCCEIDQARQIAEKLAPEPVVLGGERNALRIEGFDLGNSPEEYTPETVGGRFVVFTTTNGTRTIEACRDAQQVYIAAFTNVSAVCRRLEQFDNVAIVCAGTEGEFSRDDILLAGMIVDRLQRESGSKYQLNAQAVTARENWLHCLALPFSTGAEPLPAEKLVEQLRNSAGGLNLIKAGLEKDILTAAQIDQSGIVPVLEKETFRIVAS